MTIHMHTLIYNSIVKISDVPVYTCQACSRYEPLPNIKRDLGGFIAELAEVRGRKKFSFAEKNEWANVLKETFASLTVSSMAELEMKVQTATQSRIDLLLDLYRLAGDVKDPGWMRETEQRLEQLTVHPVRNTN
ncbi:hypothetical protein [Paenibacillus albidus]|uniref:hypothetical protein n=1 Tax=Paenibacillus albidus TaxID=2041023 RepID=UPI001BE89C1A|nr:hypothetical protein [Paenibacillus albidus]